MNLVTIHRQRVIRCLFFFLIAACLFFLWGDVVINYGRLTHIRPLRRLFNIAREDSWSAWFAATLNVFSGVVAWLNYQSAKIAKLSGRRLWGWAILACFFFYLGMDDGAMIHERIGSTLDVISSGSSQISAVGSWVKSYPSYAWQIVFVPIFGSMGLFVLFFLWKEMESTGLRLLYVSALGCFVAAVGLDVIEGMPQVIGMIADFSHADLDDVSHYQKVIEEFIEMLGNSFFLTVFVSKLLQRTDEVVVKVV